MPLPIGVRIARALQSLAAGRIRRGHKAAQPALGRRCLRRHFCHLHSRCAGHHLRRQLLAKTARSARQTSAGSYQF